MLQRTERTFIYTKHLLENTLPITQKKKYPLKIIYVKKIPSYLSDIT